MLPKIILGDAVLSAYTLFAVLGAVAAFLLAWRPLGKRGLSPGRRAGLLAVLCLAFLLGARLWNCAVNPDMYLSGDFRWYSLKMAGLSLYGGLLGDLLALVGFCLFTKTRLLPLLDALSFPGGTAFCFARVGCFLNGCCAGRAANGWWGVVFPAKEAAHTRLNSLLPFLHADNPALHPTQLYELAGALAGILLVYLLEKRLRPAPGTRFFLYAAWFSAVRLAVLPLRVLSYARGVKEIAYPMLYGSIILFGILWVVLQNHRQSILRRPE